MQQEASISSVVSLSNQQTIINKKPSQYEKEFRITFADTNAEGNVSHCEYAKYFGIVRDLLAMDRIPHFVEEAGRKYLLKTSSASYEYKRDFFGDVMMICLAHDVQEIVYTDVKGIPRRIPKKLMSLLKSASRTNINL